MYMLYIYIYLFTVQSIQLQMFTSERREVRKRGGHRRGQGRAHGDRGLPEGVPRDPLRMSPWKSTREQ